MRQRVSLLVVLLFVGVGLAGCVGEETPPVSGSTDALGDAGADGASSEGGAADVNGSRVDDGTREDNASLGEMDHMHDYWQGSERITLMDEDVTVDPFTGLAFTFFNLYEGTPGVGGAFLQLPDGAIVFEGTGKLEFTATWTEPTVTGMGLRYRSAQSEEFSEELPIVRGAPLEIEVAPEMTDMPHAKTSRWMFFLTPNQAGQTMVGTFHVKIDVIKTRDPTLFPGHPDLFAGASTLEIFSGAGQSAQTSFAQDVAGFATQSQTDDSVQAMKVVPMQTLAMTANLTVTSTSTAVGDVAEVWVEYKPADSFRFRRAQMLASDPATGAYEFAWPVEMQQTDSPYAKESAWSFRVRASTDPTGTGDQQFRGISDVQVDYEMVVVAYDAPLEGVEVMQDVRRGGS